MKITFKKHKKETGLRHVAHPHESVDIKLDKKVIGLINAPSWQKEGWTVAFTVKKTEPDNNPNCDWKWIELKQICKTEAEARELAKQAITKLTQFTFHFLGE